MIRLNAARSELVKIARQLTARLLRLGRVSNAVNGAAQHTCERFDTEQLADGAAHLPRFVFLLGAERVVPRDGRCHIYSLWEDDVFFARGDGVAQLPIGGEPAACVERLNNGRRIFYGIPHGWCVESAYR